MAVKVELFDDLSAVERAAAGSLDRDAQPELFNRLEWFRLTLEHGLPAGRPLIVRAKEADRQAWLFLSVKGARAEALGSWYTLAFDVIGRRDADLVAAIGSALRKRRIGRLSLYPLRHDQARDLGRGWTTLVRRAGWNWRISTRSLGFDDYWATRPSRLRNTAERKGKAGLETTVHTRFDAAGWADYEAVYRASWKPEEGSMPFLRALAGQEGAAGTLRLGIARHEGKPVAAQLWLVENGVATIHKLAYAEKAKQLSPGTILSMAMFRHALDVDRVSAVDFGLGDEPYKADWMAERLPVYRLTAYNILSARGLFGLGRAALSGAREAVRRRGPAGREG